MTTQIIGLFVLMILLGCTNPSLKSTLEVLKDSKQSETKDNRTFTVKNGERIAKILKHPKVASGKLESAPSKSKTSPGKAGGFHKCEPLKAV